MLERRLEYTPKVMAVDDEPDNLLAVEQLLVGFDIELIKASSGQEAVSKAKNTEFSLIILDVQMPGLNGIETAKLIKYFGASKRSPIIFLTGIAFSDQDIFKGYEAGAIDYIQKPPHPDILKSKIKCFLDLATQKATIAAQKDELREALERQKKISEDLKLARQEADRANHFKTVFLANMSHEIRTPLNAIVGFSQILNEYTGDFQCPSEVKEYLNHMNMSGQVLTEIINNVLDLSKIESGKMELYEETLSLPNLVQGIYHINKQRAAQRGIDLQYDFSSDLPEHIISDRTKLNQILLNLVSNAIKYTPEDKKVIMVAKRENEDILLQVIDEGVGIPASRQQAIFEPFEQASKESTSKYGGTGLGLSIVKEMVRLIGGDISLESEQNKQTRFTVRLPLKLPEVSDRPSPLLHAEEMTFASETILVAEDDMVSQVLIRAFLKRLDVSPIIVSNGKECLAQARECDPTIILMDINMPVMGGIEAVRELRKEARFASIPIIALTASVFQEERQRAIDAGFSSYITKPLDLSKLAEVMTEYKGKLLPG